MNRRNEKITDEEIIELLSACRSKLKELGYEEWWIGERFAYIFTTFDREEANDGEQTIKRNV